jgi:hypothetical protein
MIKKVDNVWASSFSARVWTHPQPHAQIPPPALHKPSPTATRSQSPSPPSRSTPAIDPFCNCVTACSRSPPLPSRSLKPAIAAALFPEITLCYRFEPYLWIPAIELHYCAPVCAIDFRDCVCYCVSTCQKTSHRSRIPYWGFNVTDFLAYNGFSLCFLCKWWTPP